MEGFILYSHPGAEWVDGVYSPLLFGVILLAGLGTVTLFLVGMLAYLRRRTFQLFIITVVLSILVVRSIVGFATMLGFVPMPVHHLIEHGLDFIIAALILYAVYRAGRSSTFSAHG